VPVRLLFARYMAMSALWNSAVGGLSCRCELTRGQREGVCTICLRDVDSVEELRSGSAKATPALATWLPADRSARSNPTTSCPTRVGVGQRPARARRGPRGAAPR
jgi:hypothetical protein